MTDCTEGVPNVGTMWKYSCMVVGYYKDSIVPFKAPAFVSLSVVDGCPQHYAVQGPCVREPL